jgi:RNA polymerase sigma-70 factor (ECF subfamily)
MLPDAHRDARDAIQRFVRDDRARVLAALVKRCGFDVAEEAVDTAIEAAVRQWPDEGVPSSAAAWVMAVARRRAIDALRRRVVNSHARATVRALRDEHDANALAVLEDESFGDERLRLFFTCCHPAIAEETRIALALRWLSGLSTEDVARAFCVAPTTMAQRLFRAKAKIETAGIPYEVPEKSELRGRLASVLQVLYAIFNEGYVATTGPSLQRVDLSDEAVRLADVLCVLVEGHPDALSLLALLLLVHARRAARTTPDGSMLALDEQDRDRWDRAMIARGKSLLDRSLREGAPSAYAIEAAIQALHDDAPRYEDTDFAQIADLYRLLRAKVDAPIVALNEAVARSMIDGPEAGLRAVLALEGVEGIDGHHALYAAKADLLRRIGRSADARRAYDEAIAATRNEAERQFLARRRASA